MKRSFIATLTLIFVFMLSAPAFAIVTTPIEDQYGLVSSFDGLMLTPSTTTCLNGIMYQVESGYKITLMYQYYGGGSTYLLPSKMHLWGPIPDTDTGGSFAWGGICYHPVEETFDEYIEEINTLGTIIQIGTTLLPTPGALYPNIFYL